MGNDRQSSSVCLRVITQMRSHAQWLRLALVAGVAGLFFACSNSSSKTPGAVRATPGVVIDDGSCQIQTADGGTADAGTADAGTANACAPAADDPNYPDYLSEIGCMSDFEALASLPLDITLSGVRSMKYVIDTQDITEPDDDNIRLYFQNSIRYPVHCEFCSKTIRGVGCSQSFNESYYGPPDRRFLLGSISHYEGPDTWAVELAAYDTSNASMIKKVFDTITSDKAFFRSGLAFHPTSETQAKIASDLDLSIPVVSTEELYGKTDYQPLVRSTAMGVLTFLTAAQVDSGEFIPYDSIVVLDEAPNDISVVAGIITEQFQSPLSHINVLASNRKTPNMGLRNAKTDPRVLAYKDKWIQLTVGANEFEIIPVDPAKGEEYYEKHKPEAIGALDVNNEEMRIQDIEALVPNFIAFNKDTNNKPSDVLHQIKLAVAAYGGKSANYSVLAQTAGVPVAKAFAVPVYYYDKFMSDNGFYDMINGFLTDESFKNDSTVREAALRDLRNAMMKGQLDLGLQNQLKAKITKDFTGLDGKPIIMRFRTSTNSEDLDNFPCAGCYNSQSGDPSNWEDVWDGIRKAYTSAWLFRTFEERSYYGVKHLTVEMGLLVHHKYINEVANGVAITANPFSLTPGAEIDTYYINTAYGGDNAVVALPVGVTSDQFLYFVGAPNGQIEYLSHTNQPLPAGQTTVLSIQQVAALGTALTAVKNTFQRVYRKAGSNWYAMDCEFKFAAVDAQGNITDKPVLWLKQARPYPNPIGTTCN
jgi:hypothetical protein